MARVAPISKGQFGTKNGDIAALLKWAGEDSDRRDLEFEVVSTEAAGTGAVAPAIHARALHARAINARAINARAVGGSLRRGHGVGVAGDRAM